MDCISDNNSNCKHVVSAKRTASGRFWECFLLGSKLIDKETNTTQCICCGERIKPPRFFSHPGIRLLYFLLAFSLEQICCLLAIQTRSTTVFIIGQIFVCVGIFVAVRLTNAFIFAFGKWIEMPKNNIPLISSCADSLSQKHTKFDAIFLGVSLSMFFARSQDVLIISVLLIEIVGFIVAAIRAKGQGDGSVS